MLKVDDNCKKAIDAYYEALDTVDRMNVPEAQKLQMKQGVTTKAVKEAGFRDKMAELVINSYVSALGTPAVNLISALVKAPLLVAERALISLFPNNDVKLGESVALMRGFFDGLAEGVSFAKQGWVEGMPLDTRLNTDVMAGFGKGASSGPIERGFAPVVTAPTRAGVFVDEYSKAVFRRMQLNAKAYRISRALPEKKLDGLTRDEMYNKLRTVDIGDPTKVGNTRAWQEQLRKLSPDLAEELINFAKIQTFQGDLGKLGNNLLRVRAENPEITLIVPFIKTPINILKDAASYLGAASFSKTLRKDLGLTQQEATARVLLGTGIATMARWQIASGNITGSYPKEAGKREALIAQGIPEYSVKIGDRWYSYARMEPVASVLGIFADSAETWYNYMGQPSKDRELEKLASDFVLGVTKNLASKTFLEGINGMLQAIHDPDRYGGSFLNGFASVLVPGAIAQFARGTDPVQRDVQSFADAMQNRIPGLRTDLPVKYDILGQERVNPAYGLMGTLGVATREVTDTPLTNELSRVKFQYSAPDRKLGNVELSQEDYAKYSKLSGDIVNQQLEKIINAPTYSNYSKTQQKFILEQQAQKARKVATNMILAEKMRNDPEFYDEYRRQYLKRRGQAE